MIGVFISKLVSMEVPLPPPDSSTPSSGFDAISRRPKGSFPVDSEMIFVMKLGA